MLDVRVSLFSPMPMIFAWQTLPRTGALSLAHDCKVACKVDNSVAFAFALALALAMAEDEKLL